MADANISIPMADIVDGLMCNAVKRAPMLPVAPQLARLCGWLRPVQKATDCSVVARPMTMAELLACGYRVVDGTDAVTGHHRVAVWEEP